MNFGERFSAGPLAFPVTPYAQTGELDLPTFERHLSWLLSHGTPALFVGCGTGELASLSAQEVGELVRTAVATAGQDAAVIAGVGQGLRTAERTLVAAQEAGADGALVLPPYLVVGDQEGLYRYYARLAAVTDLPLIIYQRGLARLEPETVERLAALPTIVGFKDGLGDVELMQRIAIKVGDELTYFNGMPTAELYQAAYQNLGVPNYSSAVFNFVPELSSAFFKAVRGGDTALVGTLLREFFAPLAELRNQGPGYAVSLVKAGVALRWGPVGSVRPPLSDAKAEHVRELERLIDSVSGYLG